LLNNIFFLQGVTNVVRLTFSVGGTASAVQLVLSKTIELVTLNYNI